MNELSRWLQHQSERDARTPSLEEALLGNRFGRYAAYRLRYFVVRYCATAAIHAAIVLLLYRTFVHRGFSSILVVYAATGVGESFWWGALEAMRGRIRLLHRRGKPHLIPAEIGRWLSLSIQLAVVISAATAGWCAWQLANGRFDPSQAYISVILLGLAVELVARCYHSGIYALRRVYRPIGALVAIELVSLAGILGLRPWLGSWGFPAAALLSVLTVTVVATYYARRSYTLLRLAPETRLSVRKLRLPPRAAAGELLGGGLSYALMSLDALLVLVLFGTRPGNARTSLFLLFFIISPTVRAGFDWARLLYFDLKRLEIRLFRNLRRRFQRAALKLALLLGVFFWGAASLTGTAVLGRSLGALYWILFVFFLFRSLLAVAQMDAFADGAYGALLANGALCLAGFLATGVGFADERRALLGIGAVTLLAFVLLLLRHGRLRPTARNREAVWLSEWLPQLQAVDDPVRVCVARVWSEPLNRWPGSLREWEQRQRWRRRQLGDDVAARLRTRGSVTVLETGKLLWFERDDGLKRVSNEWLLKRTGGFVEGIRDTGLAADGQTVLTRACRDGFLGPAFREAVHASRVVNLAAMKASFAELAPQGAVYAPDEPVPDWLAELPSKDVRTILGDAAAFGRGFTASGRRSRFDTTAFCLGGELRLIFVEPRDAGNEPLSEWHALIRQYNIDAAVGSSVAVVATAAV
jgi:hypothetical protein